MTELIITREKAEEFLAQIKRKPGYTYAVVENSRSPTWRVEVRDPDGNLVPTDEEPE